MLCGGGVTTAADTGARRCARNVLRARMIGWLPPDFHSPPAPGIFRYLRNRVDNPPAFADPSKRAFLKHGWNPRTEGGLRGNMQQNERHMAREVPLVAHGGGMAEAAGIRHRSPPVAWIIGKLWGY
jgi:hypothetical protein